MSSVTIHSDFEAQENKTCHCFHFFPFHLPWSEANQSLTCVSTAHCPIFTALTLLLSMFIYLIIKPVSMPCIYVLACQYKTLKSLVSWTLLANLLWWTAHTLIWSHLTFYWSAERCNILSHWISISSFCLQSVLIISKQFYYS